jgi:N-formylglutamate amidohydrolase
MRSTGPLPFRLVEPRGTAGPVVLSSPHSGRLYPPDLLATLRVSLSELRPLEDGPVDRIAEQACDAGAVLVAATLPRAYVDLNRDADELDPDLVPGVPDRNRLSAKVRAGLGVIPSRLGMTPLYRAMLGRDAVERRLREVHAPYHDQLRILLGERVMRFGVAVLLDCHSMPSGLAGEHGQPIDVAVGDRFGRAAHPAIAQHSVSVLQAAGLRVGRNRPYAGGYITEHHGRPWQGISALQVEFRRALFMHEVTHEPRPGLGGLPGVMTTLTREVGELALELAARRRSPPCTRAVGS